MSSHYHHHYSYSSHGRSNGSVDDSESGPSGATTAATTTTSSFLSTSVSSLWGSLASRFSGETAASIVSDFNFTRAPSFHHNSRFGDGVDAVYHPPHVRRNTSPLRPPPLEPLTLSGFLQDTIEDARLLTTTIAEEIRIMVPARLSICDEWKLVYSLDQDGASLSTLYDKCKAYEGEMVGFVLVVKDYDGGIFGAYLSDPPIPHLKYFGNGECFLWRASTLASLPPPPSADTTHLASRFTTIAMPPMHSNTPNNDNLLVDLGATSTGNSAGASTVPVSLNSPLPPPYSPCLSPQPTQHAEKKPPPLSPSIRFKAFPYSGVNEYYILCEPHFLSLGAGDGKYGLWLDDGLDKGVSAMCLTFGNEQLSDEGEKFGVLGVEIWVIRP